MRTSLIRKNRNYWVMDIYISNINSKVIFKLMNMLNFKKGVIIFDVLSNDKIIKYLKLNDVCFVEKINKKDFLRVIYNFENINEDIIYKIMSTSPDVVEFYCDYYTNKSLKKNVVKAKECSLAFYVNLDEKEIVLWADNSKYSFKEIENKLYSVLNWSAKYEF